MIHRIPVFVFISNFSQGKITDCNIVSFLFFCFLFFFFLFIIFLLFITGGPASF